MGTTPSRSGSVNAVAWDVSTTELSKTEHASGETERCRVVWELSGSACIVGRTSLAIWSTDSIQLGY